MTSNLSKQEKLAKQEALANKIMMIPIVLLLAIVPLITRVLVVYPTEAVADVLNTNRVIDSFSNYKATAIIVLSVIMLIILFLFFDKQYLKMNRTIKWYIIGTGLFIGISLIATLMSSYSETAWKGMPDRAEGFVITACYILMMLYTLYAVRHFENYKYVIGALGFLVIISTILGAFQYAGYDLFTNVKFFINILISKELQDELGQITSIFEKGKVYGTMFHYNYMGSFGAMMVPFFATLTLFTKGKWQKVLCGIMSICAMFLLFGSTSRAGFIGLVAAIVVGIIIFAKVIAKKWKMTLPIMIAMVAILFGFNAITGGTIFERIPTLIKESIGLFSGSDESFDYKDYIPVRDIVVEDGKVNIVLQTGTIVMENINNEPHFIDENGNEIEYYFDLQKTYTTSDERFNYVTFSYEEIFSESNEEKPVALSMSVNGMKVFFFTIDQVNGVQLSDTYPVQPIQIEYPETVGFKGKEKLGSARGYIWSRSIPLMKETLLIGKGPDTYALEFPQNDFLGKWWAYDTPNMIVDKAHSLYLQYFINNGGLALLGFLIMLGAYLVSSVRLYAFKGYYANREILGIATTLAIVGYLGAGIFNDSIISVAPVFWVLLGAGMAVNYMLYEEKGM